MVNASAYFDGNLDLGKLKIIRDIHDYRINFSEMINLEVLIISRTDIWDQKQKAIRTIDWDNIDEYQEYPTDYVNYSNQFKEYKRPIPKGMNLLINLKVLFISSESITKIENIDKLVNLKILCIKSCGLTKIENLQALKKLEILELSDNQINKIENIETLVNLKILDLRNNKIERIENLKNNENLTKLDLSLNNIRIIENISNLPLQYFDISNNKIENAILPEIINHNYLNTFILTDNPLIDFPVEYCDHWQNCLQYLKTWYFELKDSTINNYFKICLIGNGRTGKSSLLDRLERNTFDPNKDSSHGIILDHSENWSNDNGNPVTLQYWDFGGQDLYHGTHKWFLKGEHLNLLVWNNDSDPKHLDNLKYWIKICDRCNKENKVLIAQTKKEIHGVGIPEEFDVLKDNYNLINNIIHIDSEPDDPAINNIDSLRVAIQNQLSLSPLLVQKIPLSYHKVRNEILQRSKNEIELDIEEYKEICRKCGVGQLADFDDSCNLCLRWLQVSGLVFYNEHILSSRIIIDQKWAIDAVYKAFDRTSELYKTIIKNQGRFLLSDLYAELSSYTEHEQQRVLEYLQSSYTIFEIEYNYYKKPEERTFVCPRYLQRTNIIDLSETISINKGRTILKSDAYFDSDFDDIISIMGQKGLLNPDYIFKNCVVLEDAQEKFLLYKGDNERPELLGHSTFDGLFRSFSTSVRDIGLNFTYSSLEGIMVTRDHNLKEVIDKTIRIFISYAHDYQEASNIFIDKLRKILLPLQTYEIIIWADHDIFLGEDWHNRIQAEIKKSNLSILLLSDDFFNSKYIKNNEMNVFIDQQRESGYPFIPIYFSPCEYKDWEAIKKSQLFKPDKDDFEEVNSKDFAFTSLLYKGPTLVEGAENSPNVNYYFKILRRKLEEVFMNIKI